MNIPVNLFMWVLACLPIIVLLVLMIRFQWGATDAAPIGLAITVFTGIVFYKADLKVIVSEGSKGIWNALTILIIVWTAVLLYQVGNETHAFLVIRDGMRKLLPNELLLILAMGWIFESFLQGITGFGVPVAVGAPLLIGIGVKPMWAVIIPLLPGPRLLYNRNLLYTAVTRAKKCLTIVGSDTVFQEMIQNKNEQARYTSLSERIREFRDSL